MEDLKEVLGEELYAKMVEKLGGKKVVIDSGNLIPEYRFKEKVEEVKSLKERIVKNETDLNALKPLVADKEALAVRLAKIEEENKAKEAEFAKEQSKIRKAFAVKEALMDAGVEDPESRELLALKFNVDAIELDDKGKPKGFEELVKPIKEHQSLKNLFGKRQIKGQQHADGELDITLGEYAKNNPFSKATRNIAKQIELKRTNPDLASKLESLAK